jgi:DNA-binding PucR family transcriptional regulator
VHRVKGDRSLLQLLLAEAPAEAFEQPVREAEERGADAAEIAELRAEVAVALQVRTILAERRRREAELAALYETAGDLTSIRDVSNVLQALVQRARRLLGTDVAYLTLFDDDRGDTYMRVTDGIVTDSFRNLRLGMGTGLGGLVAQTRRPYATPNYGTDERFAHTQNLDGAVSGEGIVAILGVPLQFAGRVIGVLFTANRHERPFAPEEVALLESLAAHAAVAIENARLFGETQEAMAELAAANRLVREHSQAVERAAAAHDEMTGLVLRGSGAEDLAAALGRVLDGDVLIVDEQGQSLASAGRRVDVTDLADALDEARRKGRTVRVGSSRDSCWIAPVLAGADHLGAVVLSGRETLDSVDVRTLERGALVTALLLLNQRSIAEAERRVRGELLENLLTAAHRDVDVLRRRGRMFGFDVDAEHAVVVADLGADRHIAAQAATALARDLGGLGGEHDGVAVVLLPGRGAADATRLVADRLRAITGQPVTAGGAGPAAPESLIDAYERARRTLRVLQALDSPGAVAAADELGVYGLLLSEMGRADLATFLDRRLGPVMAYDERRRTDLIGTLSAYFDAGGNHARAAAALHVHVNTLYQRFERISQLIGSDWQEPEHALQIHLALRILRLRSQLKT